MWMWGTGKYNDRPWLTCLFNEAKGSDLGAEPPVLNFFSTPPPSPHFEMYLYKDRSVQYVAQAYD